MAKPRSQWMTGAEARKVASAMAKKYCMKIGYYSTFKKGDSHFSLESRDASNYRAVSISIDEDRVRLSLGEQEIARKRETLTTKSPSILRNALNKYIWDNRKWLGLQKCLDASAKKDAKAYEKEVAAVKKKILKKLPATEAQIFWVVPDKKDHVWRKAYGELKDSGTMVVLEYTAGGAELWGKKGAKSKKKAAPKKGTKSYVHTPRLFKVRRVESDIVGQSGWSVVSTPANAQLEPHKTRAGAHSQADRLIEAYGKAALSRMTTATGFFNAARPHKVSEAISDKAKAAPKKKSATKSACKGDAKCRTIKKCASDMGKRGAVARKKKADARKKKLASASNSRRTKLSEAEQARRLRAALRNV